MMTQENSGRAGRMKAAARLEELRLINGHPLQTMLRECDAIEGKTAEIRACIPEHDFEQIHSGLLELRSAAAHFSKKGDLLYPVLRAKYNVDGPSIAMWSIDVNLRQEVRVLSGRRSFDDAACERVEKALGGIENGIRAERAVLLPLCVQYFSDGDWYDLYEEIPNYDPCMIEGYGTWDEAEAVLEKRREAKALSGKRIHENSAVYPGSADGCPVGLQERRILTGDIGLEGGHMTPEQISGVLNTVPMELTFIDADSINRFFNTGEKLFKRPKNAIDRDVSTCHPAEAEPARKALMEDFCSGARDYADFWRDVKGEPVLVRYMAVRNGNGDFLGTLECVQKLGFAKEHFRRQEDDL